MRRLTEPSLSIFILVISCGICNLVGCGGGGSGGNSTPPPSPPTTASVTVSGTAGPIIHTATLTLTIAN